MNIYNFISNYSYEFQLCFSIWNRYTILCARLICIVAYNFLRYFLRPMWQAQNSIVTCQIWNLIHHFSHHHSPSSSKWKSGIFQWPQAMFITMIRTRTHTISQTRFHVANNEFSIPPPNRTFYHTPMTTNASQYNVQYVISKGGKAFDRIFHFMGFLIKSMMHFLLSKEMIVQKDGTECIHTTFWIFASNNILLFATIILCSWFVRSNRTFYHLIFNM